ncbi:MAG: hypothetical protein ACK5X2_05290, partial [Gemmatimonadaceae bacterium]
MLLGTACGTTASPSSPLLTVEATQAVGPTAEAIAAAKSYSTSMGGQTFLVLHRGQVLDESYTNGGSADRAQLLASATK